MRTNRHTDHVCVHICSHTHTQSHARVHAQMHACARTPVHLRAHALIHARTCRFKCTHTYTKVNMRWCMCAHGCDSMWNALTDYAHMCLREHVCSLEWCTCALYNLKLDKSLQALLCVCVCVCVRACVRACVCVARTHPSTHPHTRTHTCHTRYVFNLYWYDMCACIEYHNVSIRATNISHM